MAHAGDAAGSLDDVPGLRAGALDPRARDALRRHLRRRGHAGRGGALERRLLAGRARPLGGVVPEIASRHHLELVNAVVDDALARRARALDEVELVAVTQGPGLVGALLVGVATAKGLAAARALPLAPVDHLQGHVAANFLAPEPFEPPFLCLLASGGHTLLARVTEPRAATRCSAARSTTPPARRSTRARGCSGLGYPGGPALSKLALEGDPEAFAFPTGARVAGLDFSFAGLKTALLYKVRDLGAEETRARAADLAASYEHAIVEALIDAGRARAAPRSRARGSRSAAASPRTACCASAALALGVGVNVPPPELCTDNAAMIASAARWVEPLPFPDYLALDAYATGAARPDRRGRGPGPAASPCPGRPGGRSSCSRSSPVSSAVRVGSRSRGGGGPAGESEAVMSRLRRALAARAERSAMRVIVRAAAAAARRGRDDLDPLSAAGSAPTPVAGGGRGRRCGRPSAPAGSRSATPYPTTAPATASRRRSTPATSRSCPGARRAGAAGAAASSPPRGAGARARAREGVARTVRLGADPSRCSTPACATAGYDAARPRRRPPAGADPRRPSRRRDLRGRRSRG